MNYYGIVSKIKENHKSGIYGYRKPTEVEFRDLIDKLKESKMDWIDYLLLASSGITSGIPFFIRKSWKILGKQFTLKKGIDTPYKTLIIQNKLLMNNYIIPKEFLYGLFDDFSRDVFKSLLKSGGGSIFTILEKNNLPPNLIHFSGDKKVQFSEGIYVSHPKNENLLLPLKDFSKLVPSLIVEEIFAICESLGAKKITIEEKIDIKGDSSVKNSKFNASIDGNHSHKILRKGSFGKGIFDVNRMKKYKLLTCDLPFVNTLIDARIKGNLLEREFTETINTSLGISASVLNLFESQNNISYDKEWNFKVEFYDKNDILENNNG